MARSQSQGSFSRSPHSSESQAIHVFIVTDNRGQRIYSLESSLYSLGRDPSNSIVIDHEMVSRNHAMLVRVPLPHGFVYRLEDGNLVGKPSLNGTKVNGQPCLTQILEDGDQIVFADCVQAEYYYRNNIEALFNKISQAAKPPTSGSDTTTLVND